MELKKKTMKSACAVSTSQRNTERGNVLVYTVLSALFLFFAVGLGADLSHLYLAKAELQNAADAAALAGAKGLKHIPVSEAIQVAVDQAVDTMNLNKYNFNNRTFPGDKTTASRRALVTFAKNLNDNPYMTEAQAAADPDPSTFRFVKVSTPSVPVSIFFGNPLLGSAQTLNATATAGLSTAAAGNAKFCISPLLFVDGDGSEMDPSKTLVKCGNNTTYDGGAYTAPGIQSYADGTTCDPTLKYCKGCAYYIRYKGGSSPASGQFSIPACAGSTPTRDRAVAKALAAYGDNCITCGSISPNTTVDLSGSVSAMDSVAIGLNVRFDRTGIVDKIDTIGPTAETPPDTNVAQRGLLPGGKDGYQGITWNEYKTGSVSTPSAYPYIAKSNRRILFVPIGLKQHDNSYTVASMGAFFMQTEAFVSNSWIRVEYISDDIAGTIGGDPGGDPGTNVVTVVLYR